MYKILIIEDDTSMAKAMKKHLESWGNTVEYVKDLAHVITEFTAFDPHLVLVDIVMAMNMGGDDFIAKPFDLNVLTAKIQAVLRRTYDLAGKIPVLEHKGAILNLNDTSLMYEDQKIDLSKNEFRILQTLMENKGKVVSRDTLMMRLWESDVYVEENTLTVNIARLRKKLDNAGLQGFITTKVGGGYIIQ